MNSLRRRAIFGATIWAIISIGIGGIVLLTFLDRITLRRFDQEVANRHLQVVVALSNSGGAAEVIEAYTPDPEYERPYSGRYWQVMGQDGTLITSRSLFDSALDVPEGLTAEPIVLTVQGPNDAIRVMHQLIALEDGSEWAVSVGLSQTSLEVERALIRKNLLATFGFLGALAVAGAALQSTAVVRPLTRLREEVAHRWDSDETLDPDDYPEEVIPLVEDINTLLQRNREVIDRARRQAADLAHALKTPSAIMRNELSELEGRNVDVKKASEALSRMDAQIQRSLARIRAANTDALHQKANDLKTAADRLARLFRSLPASEGKDLEISVPDGLGVLMDVQDLEEVVGNILENAFEWASTRVRVHGEPRDAGICLTIEDDGPGVPEEQRLEALRSGGRLDRSTPGTGLGLSIASDLLKAYGGDLDLQNSELLGGLKVVLTLPTRHVART